MTPFCPQCQTAVPTPLAERCSTCNLATPPAGWPFDKLLGQTVAGHQYRVVRRIGSGGFGIVYLVETVVGGLRRALKVLHPQWSGDAGMRRRFVNEAVVVEELNHPNIARCYAAGQLDGDGELYLLLELVDGVPLDGVLHGAGGRFEPLPPLRAVRLAKQIAAGLGAAHDRRVLHLDLKPQNVLVSSPGTPGEHVTLVDFGIAQALDDDPSTTRSLLGTPHYMAPEQISLASPLDGRTDLWQLGTVLYQMLTGDLPFRPATPSVAALVALHDAHATAGPSPSGTNPALGACPALDALVRRLLATNPDDRPRSAAHVCEELARIEHMLAPATNVDGARDLLATLCARPSESAWRAVCRYVSTHHDPATLSGAGEVLLAGWPDVLRRAPLDCWETIRRGNDHPLWPLARTLDLSGRGLDDGDVAELAGNPAFGSIVRLELAHNQIGPEGVVALCASPYLTKLRALGLADNRIGSTGAEHLAASALAARLQSLDLASNGIGSRGAEALAASELRAAELDLSGNDVQAAGAKALAGSPVAAALQVLRLQDNRLGSDGVTALAVSHTLTNLRALSVADNGIGPAGAAALALSPNLSSLHELSLARNTLGLQGLELLLSSGRFAALENLDVSSNDIGAQGAMALASSPFARRLKSLDLSDNGLGDAGLAALLGAPYLSALRSLNVAQNGVTAAGALLVGGAPPDLEALDLSRNALGPAGAQALQSVLGRTRLTSLAVNDCQLDDASLAAIVASAPVRLARFEAAGHPLGVTGARTLAASSGRALLQHVNLSRCGLGNDGVTEIAEWPSLRPVRALMLDGNGLDDTGADSLVRALERLPALERLGLRENQVGERTLARVGQSPLAGRLVSLDLAFNALDDRAASALGSGATWPALRDLELEGNAIGLAAVATLRAAPGLAFVEHLNVARNALAGRVDLHSLARRKVDLLEASFGRVAQNGGDFAERFYARLFSRHPTVKPLFAATSMRTQQRHLLAALGLVIEHLRSPDAVDERLRSLGERHTAYGASPSHYHAVSHVMLDTLRDTLGEEWTVEVEEAWYDGLEAISATMMAGARQRALAT